MKRPYSFDDIVGHTWLCNYLKEHILNKTLPHFLIIEGAEGLGKTSLADIIALNLVYGVEDSQEKRRAYETVVSNKVSNDYIKKYELSIEGGKDVARDVRNSLTNIFLTDRPTVVICDECHNLSDAGQDVFLSDTEYISDNVYLIMLTTEVERLKASLRSRAVPIHLNPLTNREMIQVLKREVNARRLTIQNEDITLGLIAEWSECKPRTGLNILNAFASDSAVASDTIRELIGYLNIDDVLPLLAALNGSMTYGLNFISEMPINNSLVSISIECLKLKSGSSSYKLKFDDAKKVYEQLADVTPEQLITFIYGLTKYQKLTRVAIINAFLTAHVNHKLIASSDTHEVLNIEKVQKAEVVPEIKLQSMNKAPKLSDLLQESEIIEN